LGGRFVGRAHGKHTASRLVAFSAARWPTIARRFSLSRTVRARRKKARPIAFGHNEGASAELQRSFPSERHVTTSLTPTRPLYLTADSSYGSTATEPARDSRLFFEDLRNSGTDTLDSVRKRYTLMPAFSPIRVHRCGRRALLRAGTLIGTKEKTEAHNHAAIIRSGH
jgi:hypothetical protein